MIGNAKNSTISDCYATANLISDQTEDLSDQSNGLGGLIGETSNSLITHCYATGDIYHKWGGQSSGLIGRHFASSVVRNCYATGKVYGYPGSASIFGLGGDAGWVNDSEIHNCFALNSEMNTLYPTPLSSSNPLYHGRIYGATSGVCQYSNNHALKAMLIDGVARTQSSPTHKDGADLICSAVFDKNTYITNWDNAADHWIFPDEYTQSGDWNYGSNTNLPILKVFNNTDFVCAKQIPQMEECPIDRCDTPDWERLRTAITNITTGDTIFIHKRGTDIPEVITGSGINYDLVLCQHLDSIISTGTTITVGKTVTLQAATDSIYLYTFDENDGRHFDITTGVITFTFDKVVIDGADSAGGISIQTGTGNKTITGAIIRNCRATNGGAVYATIAATLTLNNCIISNNAAAGLGGGVYSYPSGGVATLLTLNNCTVSGNTATLGGGIYRGVSIAGLTLNNCFIMNNTATTAGGF
jgi:hypothetical protein